MKGWKSEVQRLKPECEVKKLDCPPKERGKWFLKRGVEHRHCLEDFLVFKIEEASAYL